MSDTGNRAELRELLIAAKLAGTKDNGNNGGYLFRSNEGAADAAVAVVQQWLRDQAARFRDDSQASRAYRAAADLAGESQ